MEPKYTLAQLIVGTASCRCGAPLACPTERKNAPVAAGGSAWSCSKRWLDPDGFAADQLELTPEGKLVRALADLHDPAYPFATYPHLGTVPKD